MKAQKFVLKKKFSGVPTTDNIELVEFELEDALQAGEVLFQTVFLSVDPYMRMFGTNEGETMTGEHLAEVIKTKSGEFPLGTLVLSKAGWVSHYVSKGEGTEPISFDIGKSPISYALSILGMPGATAYFGLEKCEPKSGETVLVSSAAGAVGHVVGQLAKLKGCTVIGIAGSDEKINWCKNELGFDHVINYKTSNYSDELAKIAPDGVEIYYDNVGGDYYHTIITKHMKSRGRILVVGSIQTYNDIDMKLFPATNLSILMKELTVRGFMVYSCKQEWPQAFTYMNKLIQEGKLKTRQNVYEGFEKTRDAFFGLFTGDSIGKAIVKTKNEMTHYGNLY